MAQEREENVGWFKVAIGRNGRGYVARITEMSWGHSQGETVSDAVSGVIESFLQGAHFLRAGPETTVAETGSKAVRGPRGPYKKRHGPGTKAKAKKPAKFPCENPVTDRCREGFTAMAGLVLHMKSKAHRDAAMLAKEKEKGSSAGRERRASVEASGPEAVPRVKKV